MINVDQTHRDDWRTVDQESVEMERRGESEGENFSWLHWRQNCNFHSSDVDWLHWWTCWKMKHFSIETFTPEERGWKKWIDPAKKGGNLAIKSMEVKSEVIINNSLVSGFSFQMDPVIEQLKILPIVQTTLKVEKIFIWRFSPDVFVPMNSRRWQAPSRRRSCWFLTSSTWLVLN